MEEMSEEEDEKIVVPRGLKCRTGSLVQGEEDVSVRRRLSLNRDDILDYPAGKRSMKHRGMEYSRPSTLHHDPFEPDDPSQASPTERFEQYDFLVRLDRIDDLVPALRLAPRMMQCWEDLASSSVPRYMGRQADVC